MASPRILFVKLSSLGDVIHHLPAVTDASRRWPNAHIAWALDPAYAELVRLHPAVSETIPVNLRSLRRGWFRPSEWKAFRNARARVRENAWDYVVDAQGLLKSAIIARGARAVRFGFDSASARERIASRFYDVKLRVARRLHAVERNRRLVAGVFGHGVDSVADYGLVSPEAAPAWAPEGPYIVMLHAASRAPKSWPEAYWVTLGQRLAERGYVVVFPAGNAAERAAAHRLAMDVPRSIVAPAGGLAEMAALLAHAWAVVGLDTGLTHLAVALGRPTIGIYCATDPVLTGLHGGANAVNLGGPGAPPSVEAVAAALGCGETETAQA
ncbi:MAG: lipopolysaccharide heptosyltransferase I [Bacillota bacterium]